MCKRKIRVKYAIWLIIANIIKHSLTNTWIWKNDIGMSKWEGLQPMNNGSYVYEY